MSLHVKNCRAAGLRGSFNLYPILRGSLNLVAVKKVVIMQKGKDIFSILLDSCSF